MDVDDSDADLSEEEPRQETRLRTVKEIMKDVLSLGPINLLDCVPSSRISAKDALNVGIWLISCRYRCPINQFKSRLTFINGVIKYRLVESLRELEKLYGILLNFVSMDRFAPQACELLANLTGPHIRRWHVETVLLSIKRVGWVPHLSALLNRMKEVRPDLVVQAVSSRTIAASFPPLKSDFEAELRAVSDRMYGDKHDAIDWNAPMNATSSKKQKRNSLIPSNRFVNIQPTIRVDITKQVILSHIRNMAELVDKFEQVTLPNRIASLLSCSEYRVLLLSRIGDQGVYNRLSRWIYITLVHEMIEKDRYENMTSKRELLRKILQFQIIIGAPLERVYYFLTEFLVDWDGVLYFDEIVGFLPYAMFASYEDLYENILRHIEKIFFVSSKEGQCKIIAALGRLHEKLVSQRLGFASTARQLLSYPMNDENDFPDVDEERVVETLDCVSFLSRFINNLCTRALASERSQTLLWNALVFNEQLMKTESSYGLPYRTVCPYALLYPGIVSPIGAVFSKACSIISQLHSKTRKEFVNSVPPPYLDEWREEGIKEMEILDPIVEDSRSLLLDNQAFIPREGSILTRQLDLNLLERLSQYGDFRNPFHILNHPAIIPFMYEYGKSKELRSFEEMRYAARENQSDFIQFAGLHLPGLLEYVATFVDKEE